MFKLRKIFNKHNNAPELEIQKISYESFGRRDRIYVLEEGLLIHTPLVESDERIYYLCSGTVNEFDDIRTVECFRITPDMIFEATCSDNYCPNVGDKFTLVSDEDKVGYVRVTRTTSGASDGFFVGVEDWSKKRTALVRFHCKQ